MMFGTSLRLAGPKTRHNVQLLKSWWKVYGYYQICLLTKGQLTTSTSTFHPRRSITTLSILSLLSPHLNNPILYLSSSIRCLPAHRMVLPASTSICMSIHKFCIKHFSINIFLHECRPIYILIVLCIRIYSTKGLVREYAGSVYLCLLAMPCLQPVHLIQQKLSLLWH